MNTQVRSKGRQRRYSEELKQRAVRMVFQLREETGETQGSVKRVAEQLDIGVESLRSWVKQAEIDGGRRVGTTSADAAELKVLRQEVKELRRANAMADSTGERNGSCEMSDSRSQENVDAGTPWTSERGAEAVGVSVARAALAAC
jgi:transposase